MRINSVEQEIVKEFVDKNKRDRILWELTDSEKSKRIMISRFAGPNILKRNCMRAINYMSSKEMEKYFMQLRGGEDVYFIGESYIGELSLREAVICAARGEICIIYCGEGIGYYQGEEESGKTPRYLLLNNS